MKKSMNLVDRVKNGTRTFGAVVAIGLAILAYSPKAEATLIPINSFADLANSSVPIKSVGMPTGTNLMVRDPLTSVDSIVEAGSYWHMGFVNYAGNDAEVVGYAENIHSDSGIPNRVGQMVGRYLETIGDGNRPHDVWTVEDVDKDGIIATYDTVLNRLTFDPDDAFYFSKDIEFNGIQGDVSQLPIFVTSGSVYLPQMTIVPEPATLGLLGLGAGALAFGRKRKYVESKVVDKK